MGDGPLDTGLKLLPWTATFITIAPVVGKLADRFGERPFMVAGLTLQAIGTTWLAVIVEPGISYSQLLAPFVVAGIGVSMAIPAAQNSVVGAIRVGDVGKAAGANSMMRELGGVLGIAVTVAVFASAGGFAFGQAFVDGFTPAVIVAAAIALLGAACGLLLPARRATSTRAEPAFSMEG